MSNSEYRLFFNNTPATREQLDRIETITIEQEVDMIWEARIEVPICLDQQGRWTGDDQRFMKSFERIRVEIRTGSGAFVPLIDGPVVGIDSQLSFEPGQSSVTIIVQDDSVFLDRKDGTQRYDDQLDHEIARQVFEDFKEQIATTEIDTDTPISANEIPPVIQRGTAMELLRCLARRWHKHAYVLPGDRPGASIGCFKQFPKPADPPGLMAESLPPLVVLGAEANTRTFNVQQQSQKPASFTAYRLNISDKGVISSTTSFRDRELLGDLAALEEDEPPAERILRSDPCHSVDPDSATTAAADRSAYGFEASGSTLASCYFGVLRPYRLVTVQAGETPVSGAYVITQVTHTLTRSHYSQSFALIRDAISEESKNRLANPIGSIF